MKKYNQIDVINTEDYRRALEREYAQKVYNLFMGKWKFEGVSPEASHFALNQLYDIGTFAISRTATDVKLNHDLNYSYVPLSDVVITPWVTIKWDLYIQPSRVQLLNYIQSALVNSGPVLDVNKDVVLVWALPSRRSIRSLVEGVISRIIEVEMTINTNLFTHKLPTLIECSDEDRATAKEVVNNILNDRLSIFFPAKIANTIHAYNSGATYLIDKLYAYKVSLEGELLNTLGINSVDVNKKERLIVPEANQNNEKTRIYNNLLISEISPKLEKANALFNSKLRLVDFLQEVRQEEQQEQQKAPFITPKEGGPKDVPEKA